MTRRNLSKCRVLITGASGGIGRDLVRQLAAIGSQVCFTARREERLVELRDSLTKSGVPDDHLAFVTGDITEDRLRTELVETCLQRFGGLDLLVNNAGVGAIGPFVDADPERLRKLFDVNFFAAAELARITFPVLRRGQAPAIVNIGSVLGHFAVPNKSEYCASKFALRGFTDALRAELQGHNIDVLSVHPNTTKSEFFNRLVERQGDATENPMQMTTEDAARKIISAISRGRHETVLSASGKTTVWLNRMIPAVMRNIFRRLG